MKIAYIVPGSGGTFYCQNCLRDTAVIHALRAQGHDVFTAPMYLPIFTDEEAPEEDAPVFFGAVNLYLKQRFPALRRMPHWATRLLDARPLLKLAAGRSGSTEADGLEDMTLDMLRGHEGSMTAELDELVTWLADHERPDAIHMSNALLLGLVGAIKDRLDVPVICSLQDEDQWVDNMADPKRDEVWAMIAERAKAVDVFISVSRYYATRMQEKLGIAPERMRIVPIGINLEGYPLTGHRDAPPVIGYLSKITESLGFSILVDAFLILRQDPALRHLRLHATGGLVGHDVAYVNRIRKRLNHEGCAGALHIQAEFDRAARLEFLQGISVLSVPVPAGEAFGTYVVEAMAAGVPVVQPDVGSFPELVEQTGGGQIYSPNTPEALAANLRPLLLDPARLAELGDRGREAVHANYGINTMAQQLLEVYQDA